MKGSTIAKTSAFDKGSSKDSEAASAEKVNPPTLRIFTPACVVSSSPYN